jgi:hypothetical protein
MALATRELTVAYGDYTISTPNNRELTNIIINTKRFEEATVELTWDISSASEAAFATEIETTEEAFRKPFQDVIIKQGSATLYSFKQEDNTGLDANPEITKREDNATGRSRRYTATITIGLPADTGAELEVGLREHDVEVSYDPARIRTITISGVFTAISSNNARQREVIGEPEADHSYNLKTLTFRRVWRELIFSQAGGGSSIVNQRLQINRLKEAPGDAPGVKRLATLTVEYDCEVDSEVTTNLRSLYDNTIRSFIVQRAKAFLGGGTVAIISDEPRIDPDVNHIHTSMVLMGTTGGNTLKWIIEIEDEFQPGYVLVPAWTGDRMSKYKYQGPAVRRRTITDTKTVLGFQFHAAKEYGAVGSSNASIDILMVEPPGGLSFVHTSSRPKFVHKDMGLKGASTLKVTDIVQTDVYEYYKEIAGTTPTGGSGGGDHTQVMPL